MAHKISLLLLPFIISLLSLPLSLSTTSPTVYELLPQFGLPSGLLPENVKSYSLSSNGDFSVQLEKECYIQFDYLVYYEQIISGTLKYGSITDLKGIQVKRFFLWFDVDEIKVDLPPSDSIYFTVGIISKELDVTQFQTVHACGDKVDDGPCGNKSRKWAFQLPAPVDEIQMLITE